MQCACGRKFCTTNSYAKLCHRCRDEARFAGKCIHCGTADAIIYMKECASCANVAAAFWRELTANREKRTDNDFRTYRTRDHKENIRETKMGARS